MKVELTKIHILFLVIWGIFLAACLFVYLNFLQPVKLMPLIGKEIHKILPEFQMQRAEIHLFPMPSLSLYYVEFSHEDEVSSLYLQVEEVKISLDILALFKGKIEISHLDVKSPFVHLTLKTAAQSENKFILASLPQDIPPFLHILKFNLEKGSLVLDFPFQENMKTHWELKGISGEIDKLKKVNLKVNSLNLPTDSKNELGANALKNFELGLQNLLISPEKTEAFLNISGSLDLFDSRLYTKFSSSGFMSINDQGMFLPSTQTLILDSLFYAPNQEIAATIYLPFSLEKRSANLVNGSVVVDDNSLTINGIIADFSQPALEGTAILHKLSLSRWFDWARNIPIGVSQFLNDISATIPFTLTPKSLEAKDIQALIFDNPLSGKGSFHFETQKLFLEGAFENVDATALFPELFAPEMPVLNFDNPPLEFDYSKPSDFTYHIDLKADKAKLWLYDFNEVSLSILPYKQGAEIPIQVKDFYKGKASATVFATDSFSLKAQMSGLKVESIINPLGIISPLSGSLNANIDIKSKGASAEEFFKNINGAFDATVKNGFFTSNNVKNIFTELNFKGNGKNLASSTFAQLQLQGAFSLGYATSENSFQASISQGTLSISPTGISLPQTIAKLKFQAPQIQGQGEGKLTFDSEKNSLSFQGFTGSLNSLTLSGSTFLNNFSNPTISGSLQGQSTTFFSFLKSLGLPIQATPNINALGLFDFQTAFEFSNNTLKLTDSKGMLDNTHFTADLTYPLNTNNPILVHLNLDTINADRYLPLFMSSSTQSSAPIPYESFLKTSLLGSITANEFWIASTPLLNMTLPFNMEKGQLNLTCTASFPHSGSLNSEISAYASNNSLQLNSAITVNNLNLLSLTQARGQEGLITGNANFQFNALTHMKSAKDFFQNMNGSWALDIGEGFFSQAFPKISSTSPMPQPTILNPQASRTHFSSIAVSGPIQNGIIIGNNFRMQHSTYQVLGILNIDLPKWIISLNADAYFGNVTKVPIKVSGSINDPNLDVKIISAITSTLTALTGGLINTLTNIITAPLKLF